MIRFILVLTIALTLASALIGCQSTPEVVPSSGPRQATSADAVKLYEKAPKRYEDLGIVETSQNIQYGENFSADPVIDQLKAEAAAKGANGLLIETTPDLGKNVVSVGAYYHDDFIHFPVQTKPVRTAKAHAVYMLEEWDDQRSK